MGQFFSTLRVGVWEVIAVVFWKLSVARPITLLTLPSKINYQLQQLPMQSHANNYVR